MNKILIAIFLMLTTSAFSQDKAKIKDFFWGSSDTYKSVTAIPAKWKNESAVIVYKREFYDYHKFGKSVTYTSAIRKRIKLQDAVAIKEFSEFSFNNKFYSNKGFYYKKGTNTIGIKIIKPNGKEIEVDVDKESKTNDKESKIAIANLEIGDVIDFYYYSIESFKSYFDYGFEPVETTLGDVYPTMNWELNLQTENDFFINFNTYNGAPDLVEIPLSNSGERKYELKANDIEKNEFPRWFFPLVELPCYKFQIYFARSGKFENMADAFLSEKERDVKKTVSKEDVFNFYNTKFSPVGSVNLENRFMKNKTFATEEEKVREVYYYGRHEFFTQFIEATIVKDAEIMPNAFEYYLTASFFSTQREFINHFMAFLKDNNISYDIIVGTANYNGTIDDLLIEQNISPILRVNTKTPIYLEYFTPFKTIDQFDYRLENTKAFVFQISKGKKIVDSELITLPSSTVKDNVSKNTTTVSVTNDMLGFLVTRATALTGQFKESAQQDKLSFYDYLNEDYDKYGKSHLFDYVRNKKNNARYRKEFEALINKVKDSKKETFKKETSQEFGFDVENHTLTFKNTGRFGVKTPFVYDETFDVKNSLIKKAGTNYIIEIGKLLTSQVEIDKKEKERKNNIYMSFPRSYENEIIFIIPAGYTVAGLEKFNVNVSNATGRFVSTAAIIGDKLVIKTIKQYENYFEPNSNWPKMIAFLDAAYQFTQEKILLKKK